jgi:hypothetical protein
MSKSKVIAVLAAASPCGVGAGPTARLRISRNRAIPPTNNGCEQALCDSSDRD